MTCLGCQRCETDPMVTLIDGRKVCSYCPDWRLECEARQVAAMAALEQRRAYMVEAQKKRGQAAYLELARVVSVVFKNT
jgi:hypothetical protein